MSDGKKFISIRFCVPSLGTKVVLAENWTFDLFHERRNDSLLKKLGIYKNDGGSWGGDWRLVSSGRYGDYRSTKVTAPAGTKLSVDRIYIRKPFKDFDSVTFRVCKKDSPDKNFCGVRFWAKLRDVNKITCLPIGDSDSLKEFESYLEAGKAFLETADRYDFLM